MQAHNAVRGRPSLRRRIFFARQAILPAPLSTAKWAIPTVRYSQVLMRAYTYVRDRGLAWR